MRGARLQYFYEDIAKQRHAAKLGMWLFLGSEVLFFAGLFTVYAFYRSVHPEIFRMGVDHNAKWLGSINTLILLIGSVSIASAANFVRAGMRRIAACLVAGTALCGIVYIAIKSTEYAMHFRHGIYPGGVGHFFVENPELGYPTFFTIYFALTGLHVIHVAIGAAIMAWTAWWIVREAVEPVGAYRVALVGLYWHFVDIIWLFLWPMFYLWGSPR